MRMHRTVLLYPLVLLCLCATPTATSLAPDDFDFKTLLGDPPADGSPVQQQEIAAMLELQAHRTPELEARCRAEVTANPFDFGAPALGAWFNAKDLPLTTALFVDIARKGTAISGAAKINWNRKRPFNFDPQIKPCVPIEKTFSYPSGHATRGILWATILAEMFPDHREALMAHGREFGTDRTLAGMHYPSDVAAGQKLGAEIARRLLADPEFRAKLDKAKEECLSAAHR